MNVVEITEGTSRIRRRVVGDYRISEIAFAGGTTLRRHAHPRSCFAVVIAGAVMKTYRSTTDEADRSTLIVMPAEEAHVDSFAAQGASIVVVESAWEVTTAAALRDWGAAVIAHRIRRELADPDAFSDLALEGLALELASLTGRAVARTESRARWLDAAIEILDDQFRDPPSATKLAAMVGVNPSHLARSFRARFGESIGSYARNVRLDWAAGVIAHTEAPLARIACEAGFADQSHFTRAFAPRFGVAPGRYRQTHG
jgi:AraC family transcriptional regulator